MSFLRHFNALLCKNMRLKWRSKCVTFLEVGLPPILVLILVAIYGIFEPTNVSTSQFVEQAVHVVPFSPLPYRLQQMNWRLGVAAETNDAATIAARDRFVDWLDAYHPALNGSSSGFLSPGMKSVFVPKPSEVTLKFDSNADLDTYVLNDDYGITEAVPRLAACIVFRSAGPAWDYSIRMNFSTTPNTFRAVDVLARNVRLGTLQDYALFRPTDVSPKDSGFLPSFSTLQLEVDRFILNSSAPAFTALDVDAESFALKKLAPMAAVMPQIAAEIKAITAAAQTNPLGAAASLSSFLSWMGSERFAPNSLSFVAFPIVGFESNGFYAVVQNIFPFFFVLTQLFPVAMLLRGLVSEKELRLREALKMMGVDSAALSFSWIAQYVLIFFIQAILIAAIGGGTMFKSSDFGASFLLFFLFGVSSVAFIVFISVFFTRTKLATIVGILLFLALYFVYSATSADEIAFESKLASALASPTAFALGIKTLSLYEDQGVGVKLGTNSDILLRNWSFDASLLMMALDTVVYLVLAWYIDEVMPASFREFGVPRPFYFFVTPAYWREVCGFRAVDEGTSLAGAGGKRFVPAGDKDEFFETPDTGLLSKGADGRLVAVRGLRREFGDFTAVKDIDLDCFEGQITVILGHNGAGKSTTFNMLTGLIPSTSGSAAIYGKSTTTQMHDVRRSLGVCPQHDVLWPTLTVREHLGLFAEVKQLPHDTKDKSIADAIEMVGLTEKTNMLSSSLSGGQKRKLSVAIALLGDPKLVILDEPTSGMDPYSRRATWEMLRTAREGRTIILTTHFMDEADLLGDRVAIMSHGKVECCGSPMFLKSKLNAGYEMTIVKRQHTTDSELGCDSDAIVAAINRHVPDTEPDTNIGAEMRVKLAFGAARTLPGLFDEFDADMAKPPRDQKLGITTYGVSVTSIESVFLTVASGTFRTPGTTAGAIEGGASAAAAGGAAAARASAANGSKVSVAPAPAAAPSAVVPKMPTTVDRDPEDGFTHATLEDVRGRARKDTFTPIGRFVTHFKALLCKRISYQARDWKFFCCSVLLPGLIVVFGLALLLQSQLTAWPQLRMSTAQVNRVRSGAGYDNLEFRVPFMAYNATQFPTSSAAFPGDVVKAGVMPNVTAEAIASDASIANSFNFINESAVPGTSRVNTLYQLNRMSTWLLQNRAQHRASRYAAFVFARDTFAPAAEYLAGVPQLYAFVNTSASHGAAIATNLASTAIAKALGRPDVSSITVTNNPLPFTKRQSVVFGQFGSLTAALVIIIAFVFVSLAPISFVVRERETSAKHQQQLAGVSIVSYWLSSFLWDYIAYLLPMAIAIITVVAYDLKEFISEEGSSVNAFVALMFLYGVNSIAFAYLVGHAFTSHTGAQVAIQLIGVISLILVIVSFVLGLITDTCQINDSLRYIFMLFPGFALGNGLLQVSFRATLPFIIAQCDRAHDVNIDRPTSYDAFDMEVAGLNIIYLIGVGLLYLALAVFVDIVRNNPNMQISCNRTSSVSEPPADDDDDVANERRRIQTGSDADLKDDVVILNRLTKTYGEKKAVKGLSFGVKVGQVFGFLGINGAGKTTTLKMLSGDVLPSPGGKATIAGFDILEQQSQVRRLLGYCPQFDALLDLLTVREHLFLFARIKGVAEADIPDLVTTKMEEMGLTMYADRVSQALSGGNRRKLSMAIALVSEPPVVFADEPSTGMDPKARRDMWKIILRIARSKATSVVLTSHSMEEVEALCSRVAIMVGGRLRCLGSIQHLKNKFGRGWMIEVRQKATTSEQVEAMAERVRKFGVVTRVGGEAADASECVVRDNFVSMFNRLGRPEWIEEVHPKRSGWMVQSAIDSRPGRDVPLELLAPWLAEQEHADDLIDFVTKTAFKPDDVEAPRLIERHGLKFRFRIPPQTMSLGSMFRAMEEGREPHLMADYSIGQTSLEQVFNQFAAQQDEEKGHMAGMITDEGPAAATKRGAAASAANTSATAGRRKVESPLTTAAGSSKPRS